MNNTVRITAPTISQAVKQFLDENSLSLDSITANIVGEKIFIDKKEYTVELSKKTRMPDGTKPASITPEETEYAVSTLTKLLSLMRFMNPSITVKKENDMTVLKVSTQGKDGLLIGKNGQNIIALQYLLSMAFDRNLRRHIPVVIDVDSYRDKRNSYLKSFVKTAAEKAAGGSTESVTDFMPSHERKLIHEELKDSDSVRTFSVGKGAYKKVVITSLL
jgi:predicted RNA-binding protein Jag